MLILTIKTDQMLAELGLFNGAEAIDKLQWEAHRTLADTIHLKIKELLDNNKLDWDKLGGIVGFAGPGSFTGLRIGLTVANALAYSLHIPIVATKNDDWQGQGIKQLLAGKNQKIAVPYYGQEANISTPKK
jgi:tRNA threonylcarbamoyladenosine biosynthesis protein TsaB